jgi:hypothetical protein
VSDYLYRLYDRYFSQMSGVYRYYLYSFSNIGNDMDGKNLTLIDFPVGKDWQGAAVDGLNFLTAVVAQPEPGTYCLDNSVVTDPVYRPLATGETTCGTGVQTMDVPVGVGKYYNTKWTDEYFYKATRLGTFWDKYAATFAISDNEGFFFRDFSSYFDVGAFQLSYWSGALKDQMLELFAPAYTGQEGRFVWRFDASQSGGQQFQPTPIADLYLGVPSVGALPKIQSATSYTLRYYGVVLPMARFNSAFDYSADYVNYSAVCLDGYADCQDFTGVAVSNYTDPLTGYTYVASRTDKPNLAIAAHMLDEAQAFADGE